MRLLPRLLSRPNEEMLLPLDDTVYVVGAVPSDDVREVITEPVLPTFELDEVSSWKSPSSLSEPLSIAA